MICGEIGGRGFHFLLPRLFFRGFTPIKPTAGAAYPIVCPNIPSLCPTTQGAQTRTIGAQAPEAPTLRSADPKTPAPWGPSSAPTREKGPGGALKPHRGAGRCCSASQGSCPQPCQHPQSGEIGGAALKPPLGDPPAGCTGPGHAWGVPVGSQTSHLLPLPFSPFPI